MTKRVPIAVAALLALTAPAAAQPRLDALGDPLPPGAVARLGSTRLHHHTQYVEALAFSADGERLISSAPNGSGCVWNAADGKLLRDIPYEASSTDMAVAIAADGKTLAATDRHLIGLWDTATGNLIARLQAEKYDRLVGLAILDDGNTVAAACSRGNVYWWDIKTGKRTRTWDACPDADDAKKGGETFRGLFAAWFSPDGLSLAIQPVGASGKGGIALRTRLLVYDLAAGKERFRWPAATDWPGFSLLRCAFSPHSKRLAVARHAPQKLKPRDGDVAYTGSEAGVWDVATGRHLAGVPLHLAPPGTFDMVMALAFSPDGGTLALTGDTCVGLWPLDATTTLRLLPVRTSGYYGPTTVGAVAFAADGKTLAVSVVDSVQLYDPATGAEKVVTQGHRGPVRFVAFSADGRSLRTALATYPATNESLTWDTRTWQETGRSRVANRLKNLWLVAADNTVAAVWTDARTLTICDPASGEPRGRIAADQAEWSATNHELLRFSPDGRFLQWGGMFGPPTRRPRKLYAVPSGKLLGAWPDTAAWYCALTTAPTGDAAALFMRDGTIGVYDLATGKQRWELGPPPGGWNVEETRTALAFAADGQFLASWESATGDLCIWNLATGKRTRRIPLTGPVERRDGPRLAWSANGRSLAVALLTDDPIRLIEVATGQVRREFRGHAGDVLCLAFSPDGRLLATGSADTTVLVWDVCGTMP
jgi:WD40 repeat protein